MQIGREGIREHTSFIVTNCISEVTQPFDLRRHFSGTTYVTLEWLMNVDDLTFNINNTSGVSVMKTQKEKSFIKMFC